MIGLFSYVVFFMIIAPPQERSNDYLPLLGALVSGLQKKKVKDEVLNADNFEEALRALEDALRG